MLIHYIDIAKRNFVIARPDRPASIKMPSETYPVSDGIRKTTVSN
ncbi:hypothetical protein [Neisseria meningitidis]|nr:hypothetical protein [Neisseria meningitidis]